MTLLGSLKPSRFGVEGLPEKGKKDLTGRRMAPARGGPTSDLGIWGLRGWVDLVQAMKLAGKILGELQTAMPCGNFWSMRRTTMKLG